MGRVIRTVSKGPVEFRAWRWIMAIADVYDALTTQRPYKAAMPQEQAFAILREEGERGGLDDRLVKLFIIEKGVANQP